jgi:hypothetical protein
MNDTAKEIRKMSTATEKALAAKAQMESLFQAAIDEQLAIIKEAEQKLGELGYGERKKKSGTRNTDPANKFCALCDMKGHDQRAHRSQGDKKRKFTAKELDELGLSK